MAKAERVTMTVDTHGVKIQFGRHIGELFTRLPVSYLKWMVNDGVRQSELASAELERRGTVTPELEISHHAIDRASTRLEHVWKKDRIDPDEGVYTWLHRVAVRAWKDGERMSSGKVRVGVAGHVLKMAFEDGLAWPVLKTIMEE